MKTSLNPLMYINSRKFIFLKEDSATNVIKTLKLKAGDYYVSGRSGGGAGSSGAGGIGEFFENNFTLLNNTEALYNVGAGGLVFEEGGNGGNYINLPVQVTFTIVPTPSDATVILTANGVAPASSVYDFGYVSNTTIEPDGADGGTFSPIETNYEDMSLLRYQQNGNSITVEPGTFVTYTVLKDDYVTQTATVEVTEDTILPIELVSRYKTLTIVPDPVDAPYATVSFDTGEVSGNSTTVYEGTSVTYTVSRSDYRDYSDTIVVTADQTINVPALQLDRYTLTINPDPSDAIVTLTATGYTQDGNSIVVRPGTVVGYTVSKTDYEAEIGNTTVNNDKTLNVKLLLTPMLYTTAGTISSVTLPAGTYDIVLRGSGGSGGNSGTAGAHSNGGIGGAGGKGEINQITLSTNTSKTISLYVGNAGSTSDNGGAGGAVTAASGAGGKGGGGGEPTYIIDDGTYYYANGGGGAGGGGGGTEHGRYAGGGGGGGGGGYYKLVNGTITSVAGQTGAKGRDSAGYGSPNGITGNTSDFPSIKSGDGGAGFLVGVAPGAYGGGASGAGGGGGKDNDDGWWGGAGGGGAGGSTDASGGHGGYSPATYDGRSSNGENGSNYHETPTDTTEENASYGVTGNYGIGGTPGNNGTSGFVYIKQTA